MVATGQRVEIFRSSDGLQGPEVARSITDQIRQKVAESAVLLAVYTDQDADWAWVMFEMGIAMDPTTPVTRVVVIQCGEDAPSILSDFKRVRVSSDADRTGFARDLLGKGFFPTHPEMVLAGSSSPEDLAREQGALLLAKLKDFVPPSVNTRRDWSPHPSIRVDVPLSALGALWPIDAERIDGLRLPILQQGKVVAEDDIRSVFNMQTLLTKSLDDLSSALRLEDQADWIESCVHQLAHCIVDNRPTTPMTVVRSRAGVSYQPMIVRVQHKWFDKVVRFDIIFVPASLMSDNGRDGTNKRPVTKKS